MGGKSQKKSPEKEAKTTGKVTVIKHALKESDEEDEQKQKSGDESEEPKLLGKINVDSSYEEVEAFIALLFERAAKRYLKKTFRVPIGVCNLPLATYLDNGKPVKPTINDPKKWLATSHGVLQSDRSKGFFEMSLWNNEDSAREGIIALHKERTTIDFYAEKCPECDNQELFLIKEIVQKTGKGSKMETSEVFDFNAFAHECKKVAKCAEEKSPPKKQGKSPAKISAKKEGKAKAVDSDMEE
jgi:hypothetical protein